MCMECGDSGEASRIYDEHPCFDGLLALNWYSFIVVLDPSDAVALQLLLLYHYFCHSLFPGFVLAHIYDVKNGSGNQPQQSGLLPISVCRAGKEAPDLCMYIVLS